MAAAAKATETFETIQLTRGYQQVFILGKTPLIVNRMSEKAKRQLLLPPRTPNRAERQSTLKHEPVKEFRASPYRMRGDDSPTLLGFPCMCFKNAMASAAVDMPGAAKAQIGRLAYVEGNLAPLYGIPELYMAVVRQAGMTRAPDIRTRAILPNWATVLMLSYATPLIKGVQVSQLMQAAGIIQGVGDWRPEKGKGNHGQFEIVDEGDPRWLAIAAHGGREAQVAAMEKPACFDLETEDLLTWYEEEVIARGFDTSDDGADLEEDLAEREARLDGLVAAGRFELRDDSGFLGV